MKIVTATQMAELDRCTIREKHITEKELITRAGEAAADWISQRFDPQSREIRVLAGKGNNGADALVAAKLLQKRGYAVRIFKLWQEGVAGTLAKEMARAEKSRTEVVLVDGLFGTGLNRPVREPFRSLLRVIRTSRLDVVALDLPSGLDANTGRPLGACLRARYTLTFGLPKHGLVQERAANDVGELHVLDIGFSRDLIAKIKTSCDLIAPGEVASFFQPRPRHAHKGTLGRVLVLGGSVGLAGAPVLAARGALRSGAGLVTLVVPAAIYRIAAKLAGPEIMVLPYGKTEDSHFKGGIPSKLRAHLRVSTALVVGPGMGRHTETRRFLERLLREDGPPLILDADGLNLASEKPLLLDGRRRDVILTPHPAEMGRLAGISTVDVQRDRFGVAAKFAKHHGVTVVLKGARTVIAHPTAVPFVSGGGTFQFSVNALAGNPGMATGGSGDVLAGIFGALLARGLSAADAARCGVFLHARAGDLALPETGGGTAVDLAEALPHAMAFLGEGIATRQVSNLKF